MGMFDSVFFTGQSGEDCEVQFKCGDCIGKSYEIGNAINLPDAIYCDYDACFVVYKGIIVAAFEAQTALVHKRGYLLPYPDLQIDTTINQQLKGK